MPNSNNFSVTDTSIFDNDTTNFLLGNSSTVTSNPTKVEKIEEDPEKEKKIPEQKIVINEDDIFDDTEEEDEVVKKPINKKTPTQEESQTPPAEESQSINFKSLTDSLISLGVLSELEDGEEITSDEDFAEKFRQEAILKANQEIHNILSERHGEEGLKAFQAIYINGMSPFDYFGKQSEILDLQNIDISEESGQEKVLREYYKELGWSEDKISKKIDKAINYGDLEEDAKDAYDNLLQSRQVALEQEIQQKQKEAQVLEQYKQQYKSKVVELLSNKLKSREFDGVPVTEKVANDVMEMLTVEKWKLPNGEKLTDFDKEILELKRPENYERKVKLALLLKHGLDLSKIKTNTLVTKKTNKLFEDLVVKDTTVKRNPKISSSSFFDNI